MIGRNKLSQLRDQQLGIAAGGAIAGAMARRAEDRRRAEEEESRRQIDEAYIRKMQEEAARNRANRGLNAPPMPARGQQIRR